MKQIHDLIIVAPHKHVWLKFKIQSAPIAELFIQSNSIVDVFVMNEANYGQFKTQKPYIAMFRGTAQFNYNARLYVGNSKDVIVVVGNEQENTAGVGVHIFKG